jgi:hypothetical protein
MEGECQLDESKAPEWMDVEIKTKEFNILIDDLPKMDRIGDYWSDKTNHGNSRPIERI